MYTHIYPAITAKPVCANPTLEIPIQQDYCTNYTICLLILKNFEAK